MMKGLNVKYSQEKNQGTTKDSIRGNLMVINKKTNLNKINIGSYSQKC